MKFDRLVLIKTLEDGIKAANEKDNRDFSEALDKFNTQAQKWLAGDHLAYFIEAADKLRARANAGYLITTEDLAPLDDGWGSAAREHVFRGTRPEPKAQAVREQETLLMFLHTVADDEVTSSGLRDVGFRNIARLLQAHATK